MFLAGAIFVLTIVLVIWQQCGLSIGWTATMGALLPRRCRDDVAPLRREHHD